MYVCIKSTVGTLHNLPVYKFPVFLCIHVLTSSARLAFSSNAERCVRALRFGNAPRTRISRRSQRLSAAYFPATSPRGRLPEVSSGAPRASRLAPVRSAACAHYGLETPRERKYRRSEKGRKAAGCRRGSAWRRRRGAAASGSVPRLGPFWDRFSGLRFAEHGPGRVAARHARVHSGIVFGT